MWNRALGPQGQNSPPSGQKGTCFCSGGSRIPKRSIFESVWRSNVQRHRADTPCEEVEPRPEGIEPQVCCASKPLLMGHGGPLIPVWLFPSLPALQTHECDRIRIRSFNPQKKTNPVFSAGVFTHPGFQKAAGWPDDLPVWIRSARGIPWLAHRASEGAAA